MVHPADLPLLLQAAVCSSLCNDSHLTYAGGWVAHVCVCVSGWEWVWGQ